MPPITQTTNYTGKILAKNVTETVDGETYTNVIKININQQTVVEGMSLSISNTEYWYAKDVGVIKNKIYTGDGTYESILVNYILN